MSRADGPETNPRPGFVTAIRRNRFIRDATANSSHSAELLRFKRTRRILTNVGYNPGMNTKLSRRRLLTTVAASLAAAPFAKVSLAQDTTASKAFRVAHLTDLHHQEKGDTLKGIESCLAHALEQKPDLILVGGDLMTGTMAQPIDVARRFMGDVSRVLGAQSKVPMLFSVGNHDMWGWNKTRSKATSDEPEYGKKWWADTFAKGKQYMSTDAGGWHVVVLDSVQPFEEGYEGGLDQQQFEWLSDDLSKVPTTTPVLVLTHIPIISGGVVLTDGRIGETGGREDLVRVPRPSMFVDAWRVVDLLSRYPNVKLVLSGHIHINERLDFAGVTHICGGAVSGAWWRTQESDAKRRRERDPQGPIRPLRSSSGYGVVDLAADGSFVHKYVDFGWKSAE